jgi:hypothetical protein
MRNSSKPKELIRAEPQKKRLSPTIRELRHRRKQKDAEYKIFSFSRLSWVHK